MIEAYQDAIQHGLIDPSFAGLQLQGKYVFVFGFRLRDAGRPGFEVSG